MHIGHWRSLAVETKPIAFTLPTSGWAFTDIGGTGVSGRVGVAVPLPSRRAGASTRPPANHGISLIFCPPGRGPCPSAYAPLIWPNPTTRENDAQGLETLTELITAYNKEMSNDFPHCNPQRRSSVEYRIHGGRAHYQIMTAHRRSHGAVARHHGRSRRASHSDADLLGALILKSATYQADHAGYGDRHLYDAAMLASLITDPDAETRRLHSHTDRRRIKLPYDMLTDESPYWNNLDEQHRRTGFDAIETLADW